ncbi:MAG: fibronectin type III domain-containing protein, partial [Bacteroidota bacterium]
ASAVYQTGSTRGGNSISVNSLTSATSYNVTVIGKNGDNSTENGTGSTAATETKANPPTSLEIPTTTSSSITLSWDTSSNGINAQYLVTNDSSSGNSGWITTNTWTQTGLQENTSYTFTIKARNAAGTETSTTSITRSTGSSGSAGGGTVFIIPQVTKIEAMGKPEVKEIPAPPAEELISPPEGRPEENKIVERTVRKKIERTNREELINAFQEVKNGSSEFLTKIIFENPEGEKIYFSDFMKAIYPEFTEEEMKIFENDFNAFLYEKEDVGRPGFIVRIKNRKKNTEKIRTILKRIEEDQNRKNLFLNDPGEPDPEGFKNETIQDAQIRSLRFRNKRSITTFYYGITDEEAVFSTSNTGLQEMLKTTKTPAELCEKSPPDIWYMYQYGDKFPPDGSQKIIFDGSKVNNITHYWKRCEGIEKYEL